MPSCFVLAFQVAFGVQVRIRVGRSRRHSRNWLIWSVFGYSLCVSSFLKALGKMLAPSGNIRWISVPYLFTLGYLNIAKLHLMTK
ncbi:hypothetical protein FKM82_005532 [Ascaphus truei]